MDVNSLIKRFNINLKSYQDHLNEIKNELGKKGQYGAGNSFYPLSDKKEISWILDSLKKMEYNTLLIENEVSKIDMEFESYTRTINKEYFDHLYNDLNKLIAEYESYFKDFQKNKNYFRTKEEVDPLYKEYFLKREEGLFFADGYEFDIVRNVRTYIGILFEYLNEKFDVLDLRSKVNKLDSIFKRDIEEILKILKINDEYSRALINVPYAPKEYWWLHL